MCVDDKACLPCSYIGVWVFRRDVFVWSHFQGQGFLLSWIRQKVVFNGMCLCARGALAVFEEALAFIIYKRLI